VVLTEVQVAENLLEFRRKQDGFIETSFDTISGICTCFVFNSKISLDYSASLLSVMCCMVFPMVSAGVLIHSFERRLVLGAG
jgi:hypothetical protein